MLVDHIIIGGGILGLCLAKELRENFPDQTIALFEKTPFLGDMATGRNSGVLHGGLYYPTNSLKHLHCIEGNKLWRTLAEELSINLIACGKYIFSTPFDKEEVLTNLYENAIKNNVPKLRYCRQDEIDSLKKYIDIENGIFSGSTGVLDIADAVKKIDFYLSKNDVFILKNDPVSTIQYDGKEFLVESKNEKLKSRYLYNCAGGFAVDLRSQLELHDIESYWVKGNYVRLKGDYYKDALLYPLPHEDLKGLGVHTVIAPDGMIYFGPDTEDVQEYEHSQRSDIIDQMLPAILRQFKNIEPENLEIAYCGIRPKIKMNEKLYSDFYFGTERDHHINNYFEFLGVESPGLTAAPSLVKLVIESIHND